MNSSRCMLLMWPIIVDKLIPRRRVEGSIRCKSPLRSKLVSHSLHANGLNTSLANLAFFKADLSFHADTILSAQSSSIYLPVTRQLTFARFDFIWLLWYLDISLSWEHIDSLSWLGCEWIMLRQCNSPMLALRLLRTSFSLEWLLWGSLPLRPKNHIKGLLITLRMD